MRLDHYNVLSYNTLCNMIMTTRYNAFMYLSLYMILHKISRIIM